MLTLPLVAASICSAAQSLVMNACAASLTLIFGREQATGCYPAATA